MAGVLRWEKIDDKATFYAWSGNLIAGWVSTRLDGGVYWTINAVHMRHIGKASGENCKSIAAARRALARSWSRWLDHAGLAPSVPAEQQHQGNDDHDEGKPSDRAVAPIASPGVGRDAAEQQHDEQDEQNCA